MVNHCAGAVTVGGLALRTTSPAWTLAPVAVPFDVTAGSSRSFAVTYAPSGGPADDVLLIDVTAPTAGHRAISLKGQ